MKEKGLFEKLRPKNETTEEDIAMRLQSYFSAFVANVKRITKLVELATV